MAGHREDSLQRKNAFISPSSGQYFTLICFFFGIYHMRELLSFQRKNGEFSSKTFTRTRQSKCFSPLFLTPKKYNITGRCDDLIFSNAMFSAQF
jgi:hypothetical protein